MTKPLTTEEVRAAIGQKIVALLAEEIWQIDGTPTATVKQLDGQFRKRAMVPGAEFVLISTYYGTREEMIFQFEPVGAKEYLIEASWREVDKLFADFGATLGESAGVESENTQFVVTHMARALVKEDAQRVEEELEEEAKRTKRVYQDNPNFGRF